MTPRHRAGAARAFALVGILLAAVDVGSGLVVPGGYTLELVYLHVAAITAGAVLIGSGLRRVEGLAGPLPVGCALVLGAQLPWTMAGSVGRPWFAVAGMVAVLPLSATLVLCAERWPSSAVARQVVQRLGAVGSAARSRLRRAGGSAAPAPATSPTDPGWYPDPDASTAPCWRWWDGRDWTEHRSPDAAT